MFEIIEDSVLWERIVRTFPEFDVYYLPGYARGFEIHGDGQPLLLYYTQNGFSAACVVLKRLIPGSAGSFDLITPYGYGGFIFDGDMFERNLFHFRDSFFEAMKSRNIISAFFRYHPVLNNQEFVRSIFPIIDLGKTIDMELQSSVLIDANLTSKNRNMIRKARKNGVTISCGKGLALFDQFIPIYNSTMDRDLASPYYYFTREFYESIDRDLADNYLIFYAKYNNQIIAMSIILFANKNIHYHLSGSLPEFRHLAPTNLLLYEAAIWGADHNYERFHLGGGVGADEDNLYKFKESFNRNSGNQFSISKIIFDPIEYSRLVEEQCCKNVNFSKESHFFPLYRAK